MLRVLHECVDGRHNRAGPRRRTDPAVTAVLWSVLDQQPADDQHQVADEPARGLDVGRGPLVVLFRQVVCLVQVDVEIVVQQVTCVGECW